jgi:hypothetical protein
MLAIAFGLIAMPLLWAADAQEASHTGTQAHRLGQELAVPRHLADDEEFSLPLKALVEYGQKLFMANWTEQDGAGRPTTKGNGAALADPAHPLVGMRAFNRVSGPDTPTRASGVTTCPMASLAGAVTLWPTSLYWGNALIFSPLSRRI